MSIVDRTIFSIAIGRVAIDRVQISASIAADRVLYDWVAAPIKALVRSMTRSSLAIKHDKIEIRHLVLYWIEPPDSVTPLPRRFTALPSCKR